MNSWSFGKIPGVLGWISEILRGFGVEFWRDLGGIWEDFEVNSGDFGGFGEGFGEVFWDFGKISGIWGGIREDLFGTSVTFGEEFG